MLPEASWLANFLVRCACESVRRASARKTSPAWVNSTLCLVRLNSWSLSSSSNVWICAVSGGLLILRRAAAFVELSSSATTPKYFEMTKLHSLLWIVAIETKAPIGLSRYCPPKSNSKVGNTLLNISAAYPNQTFTGWIPSASPVSK